MDQETSLPELSNQLLLAIKMQKPHQELVAILNSKKGSDLFIELNTDALKKAFWINIYNAFFQILRKDMQLGKPAIFRNKVINIAGHLFSLDDIEHGILRRFRWKLSLGYLPNIFTSKLIRKLAAKKVDYRIHFALNCGAESCPPIAFYDSNRINDQLDMATQSFLESETSVDHEKKIIFISKLFQWFRGDFGGQKGIRTILKQQINVEQPGYKLDYNPYSWNEQLDNYA